MKGHSNTFWLYFISFFSLHILFTSSIHIPESVLLSSDINSDSFPGFIVLCEGNCTNDIVTQTSYGVGLFGGDMYPKDSNITINQTHPDWYGPDLAFDWLIEKAGNGDIIVLKYAVLGSLSDCNFYNDYLYSLGNVHSVTTICFFEKFLAAPNSETVYNLIIQSEGLFFSGGDQWDYVSLWNNTKVTEGIQYLINNNRPLSGSSAGLAILGQYVYTAEYVSATSKIALHHPFGPEVTLTNNFLHLPGMSNIITDTHFFQRNRMGRLCVFLARILTNGWGENIQGNINYIHGVGVSQKTGVLLEANGTATIVGLGPVYFITANTSNIITCEEDSPLSFENFQIYRLVGGKPEPQSKNFNFKTWTGVGGNEYYLSATDGVLSSTDGGVYGFGIDYYGDYEVISNF